MDKAPVPPLAASVSRLRRRALRSSLDALPRLREVSGQRSTSGLAATDPTSNRPLRLGTTGNAPKLRPFAIGDDTAASPVPTRRIVSGASAQTMRSATATTSASTTSTSTTSTSTTSTSTASTSTTSTSTTSTSTTTTTSTATTSTAATASTVTTTNTRAVVTTTTGAASAGPLPPPRPSNPASQLRQAPSSLYGAILAGDVPATLQHMRDGQRIFASQQGKGPGITMFQFALECDAFDCALAMLRHCGPQDALERDARLRDLFQRALERKQWGTVEILLALFGEIKLTMRSRNFAKVFQFLLSSRKLRYACALLALGSCRALTQKQLIEMTRNALKFGDGVLMNSLVVACPEVLALHANSLERALQLAKSEALAALLMRGFAWPALNEEKLSALLTRLLAGNEESACNLVKQFPQIERRFGELLLAAIRNGAPRFLEQLLNSKACRAEQWQATLYAALLHAVEEGFGEALHLLKTHGIELFQQPKTALSLLARLVEQSDTRALASLIQSGQVSRDSVFLRLIRHQKVEALGELQERLGLSFFKDLRAKLLLPAVHVLCSDTLAGLLQALRDVAQGARNRQEKMMSVLMQSGFCWYTALNLVDLRDRLMHSGIVGQGHYERQFLFLVAAMLENLKFADYKLWPGPQFGLFGGIVLSDQHALINLGSKVLLHRSEILMGELNPVVNGAPNADADLNRRLQMQVGLPPEFAQLVEAACQQALKTPGPASRPAEAARGMAVARALSAGLTQLPAPHLNRRDPHSVWHDACRTLLRGAINALHWAAQQ